MKRICITLSLLCLIAGCAVFPTPDPYKCGTPPEGIGGIIKAEKPIEGRYLVTYKKAPRASLRKAFEKSYGVQDVTVLDYGFAATMTEETARAMLVRSKALGAGSEILVVEEEQRYTINTCTYGKSQINQRNPEAPDADCLYGMDGTGIHACILDTGIDPNQPDFAGRIGDGFVADGIPGDWKDRHGHGTHVAGTVGGTQWGVAPGVILHAVRVLDSNGSGTTAGVVQGIDRITAWAKNRGWPITANASLGGGPSPAIDLALCRSKDAGVIWVVAAGNSGDNACGYSPARVADIFVTGAIDKHCNRTSFSNHGECLDFFAAGLDVESARMGGGSVKFSGTSMASPHAAGVAALCLQAGLDVQTCLVENATPEKVQSPGGNSPNLVIYFRQ